MTATFDNTLPTPLDRVRRAIGDTTFDPLDPSTALRQDEEILATLTLAEGDEMAATGALAAGLAVEYAQAPTSINTGGDSISWGERVKTWLTVAEQARGQSTVVIDAATGVWAEQLVRIGFGEYESEYDPWHVECTW